MFQKTIFNEKWFNYTIHSQENVSTNKMGKNDVPLNYAINY